MVRMDERKARLLVAAVEAVRRRGMCNVIHVGIHVSSGLKADLIVAPADAFNESRFARVRPIQLSDGRLEPFATPEDVILKKLVFFREGGSEKHLCDIASMIAVQGSDALDWSYLDWSYLDWSYLDWSYLEEWSVRLGVAEEFGRVRPDRPA